MSDWQAINGRPSAVFHDELWSLACEVLVEHERFDEASPLARDAGFLVNRHLRRERRVVEVPRITRDTPGIDEDPRGPGVSIASGTEKDAVGLAGRLVREDDTRTRHQRDWDFLADHVEQAYRRYFAFDPMPRSVGEHLRTELNDWEKAEALARYANTWSIRAMHRCTSCHPCDVLFTTSDCGGSSMLLFGLAYVAGLPCRTINTINHSTVEIQVGGRWLWCDNIVGSRTPLIASYQEMLEDPHDQVCMTPLQRKYADTTVCDYRAPYNFASTLYWRMGGYVPETGRERDLASGIGISCAFDPSTAVALYPGRRRYVFRTPQGMKPTVNLSKKGGWISAALRCDGDACFRKVFELSDSGDNPVTGARAAFWCDAPARAADFTVRLDGRECRPLGERSHLEFHRVVEYELPRERLVPGAHEITIVASAGGGGTLIAYPDVMRPYEAPSKGRKVTLPAESFRNDPISATVHH